MIRYQIAVYNTNASTAVFINDFIDLDMVLRGDHQIGALTFTVDQQKYLDLFTPKNVDYRVQVYRSVNDLPFKLEGQTEFLILKWNITDTAITVVAEDLQTILQRRINAYPTSNVAASFTGKYAGDIIKAIVRNNYITRLSGRNTTTLGFSIGSYLSVDIDRADGLLMDISCSRDNVYDVVEKICYASQDYGYWITARIVSNGTKWTLKTFDTCFGNDRSDLVFSRESKNIENIRLEYDRTEEYTVPIVGGSGVGASRIISYIESPSINNSPLYRRELFYSNPQVSSVGEATYYAQALARQYRGQMRFTAELVSSPYYVRGVDYDLGDIITVNFQSILYTTRIEIIRVSVRSNEITETIELRLA